MRYVVSYARNALTGKLRVPSDKSLSHRAILFAAMASGTSRLRCVLDSEDVRSTMNAVVSLGARANILGIDENGITLDVTGWGSNGPTPSSDHIDCGNSGTTARLLMGVLSSWPVNVTLFGDASLSSRPMLRVTDPLSAMGARCVTNEGKLPVTVSGGKLAPVSYTTPVASAQVKSAILLAGLRACGRTTVVEPALSRDHTERLLARFGVVVGCDNGARRVWVDGPVDLTPADVTVPADPSSAAFPVVAALMVRDSAILLQDVCLNPTRIGFLRVLERMGAEVTIAPTDGPLSFEPIGDIAVKYSPNLIGTEVKPDEIPSLVDEIPILSVLAASADGPTRFIGVSELRVKETDRLDAVRSALTALGVRVTVSGDTLEIAGRPSPQTRSPVFNSAVLDSLGDHRLAMAWAIAGLSVSNRVTIDRFDAVAVSYPSFVQDMGTLGAW